MNRSSGFGLKRVVFSSATPSSANVHPRVFDRRSFSSYKVIGITSITNHHNNGSRNSVNTLSNHTLNNHALNSNTLNSNALNSSALNSNALNSSTLNSNTLNSNALNSNALNSNALNNHTLNRNQLIKVNKATVHSLPTNRSFHSGSRVLRGPFGQQRNAIGVNKNSRLTPPINFGFVIVPQQRAYVIERFGKFSRILPPGLHLLIPLVENIAYAHSLKEEAIPIGNQQAISSDNVTISIDGVLYIKVVDPYHASYGVENAPWAVMQLAQTIMRSEIGKMTLDTTLRERDALNEAIVRNINKAAESWGVQCLRYEIRDILPPPSIRTAMDMQAEAERTKRAAILRSEADRQSDINVAEGRKASVILDAEAEADAIVRRATATAEGIRSVSSAMNERGGESATQLRVAEKYIEAFGNIAKQGNTMLLPSNMSDPGSMIAQALAIYRQMEKGGNQKDHDSSSSSSTSDSSRVNSFEGGGESENSELSVSDIPDDDLETASQNRRSQ